MNYLLIETKDKRKFLTHEKHLLQLIEFSKTFSASLFIVKSNEKPMELEEIVNNLCNSEYQSPEYNYEIIETKLENRPIIQKAKKNLIKNSDQIKNYIEKQFKNKNIVSVKELKSKFKQYNLSDSTFSNHIKNVKLQIEKQGFKVKKVGTGKYSVD